MKLEMILDFCVRDLCIYFCARIRANQIKKHYFGKLQHRGLKDSAQFLRRHLACILIGGFCILSRNESEIDVASSTEMSGNVQI